MATYTSKFMSEELGVEQLPTHVYHYTSIESLAYILKYRTLRFTRLDLVNDPNEAQTVEIQNANKLIHVSCWSNNEIESIPMWSMYTKNMDGVRIKAPVNMFEGRQNPVVWESGGSTISIDNMFSLNKKGKSRRINGPNKIFYTDKEELLKSTCLTPLNSKYTILDLNDIGLFKHKFWEYENEWRFKITSFVNQLNEPNEYLPYTLKAIGQHFSDFIHFDIPIDESALKEFELVLGPKISQAQRIIVESLVNTYFETIKISASDIPIR